MGRSVSMYRDSHPAPSDDDDSTESSEPAVGIVETVVGVNQILQQQIEALRLRIDFEEKQHTSSMSKVAAETERQVKKRDSEIDDLKDNVSKRDRHIDELLDEHRAKDKLMKSRSSEIEALKLVVTQTEKYAKDMQSQVRQLSRDKKALQTGTIFEEQQDEINSLKEELRTMKEKVTILERELVRAAKIMDQQGVKMKSIDSERSGLLTNFKGELDKATKSMRQEVERMREVMRKHWEEMKTLREQNHEIQTDVKEIKDLLLNPGKRNERESVTPLPRQTRDVSARQSYDYSDRNSRVNSPIKTPRNITPRQPTKNLPPISVRKKWVPIGKTTKK